MMTERKLDTVIFAVGFFTSLMVLGSIAVYAIAC